MRITDYLVPDGCVILRGVQSPREIFGILLKIPAGKKRFRPFSRSKNPEGWKPDPSILDGLCAIFEIADLGNGVCLPHARVEGISAPRLYVVSIPEGLPTRKAHVPRIRLLFVFLTPISQSDVHLKLLAHLAWLAGRDGIAAKASSCKTSQELMVRLLAIESSGKGRFVSLDLQSVYDELKTGPNGLTEAESARRRRITGPNEIESVRGKPVLFKLARNFVSVFALLLWCAGALCFIPGVDMPQLGWAIFAVIVVNSLFSFWQESKAEKAVEALRRLIPRDCTVLRDGAKARRAVTDLVFGDVVFLEEGDRIPVDARLIESDALQVNNAILTGESRPVYKIADSVSGNDEPWFLWTELPNLVFAGTSVCSGTGKAVVIGTAMGTEIGHIALLTQSVKVGDSPLQKEIKGLVNILTALSVGIGILFFFLGTFLGGLSYLGAFIFTIGITVANIPEGLLPTMSLALAMGVQRLSKKNVLVKNLASVETLGSTTVICTDKTGTLTTNHISVARVVTGGVEIALPATGASGAPIPTVTPVTPGTHYPAMDRTLRELLRVACLCNNSRPGMGDPTESSLLELADAFGVNWEAEQKKYPRIAANAFDSVRKRMSTLNAYANADGKTFVCAKGAPLELLSRCVSIMDSAGVRDIVEADRAAIRADVDRLAGEGLRTLSFARKETGSSSDARGKDDLETDLCYLGLTGMEDPPRPEVPAAVASCRAAGIRLIMITGDYGLTAMSIARLIGMVDRDARAEDCLLSGLELGRIDDGELMKRLRAGGPLIIARADPEQKMRVVSCLKELGEIVAVTGDGVNDAAALKKADIGIAMGREVNDVAKEAAEMIVLDGNFASIPIAIEEGRAVYSNIRRFSTYVLASNMPELAPFLLFVMLKIPLALTVMQILAIDLGTDLVPALGLGAELAEPGIMDSPPRSRKERLVNAAVILRAYVWLGGMEIALSLLAFFYAYWSRGFAPGVPLPMSGPAYAFATTMTLVGIVACQIGNVFGCRTSRESVFRVGFFGNRLVLLGIAVEICLILCLAYVPFLRSVFGLAPLALRDWAFVATFPFIMLALEETRKAIVRRMARKR